VVPQRPKFARFGAWGRTCGLQRGIEVERFDAVLLIAGVQVLEQLLELFVAEAGESERSRPSTGARSASRRASSSWSQSPLILLSERFRRRACSRVMSRKIVGTVL
jgi:hypothetical protein